MMVRLKKDYKTKKHEHYLPKGKLIHLYKSFDFLGTAVYTTNMGFRILCKDFDELFIKVGED